MDDITIAEVVRLYTVDLLSVQAIADRFGRSYSFAYDRLAQAGVPRRAIRAVRLKPPAAGVLAAWYAEGKSTRDIAKMMQTTGGTVRRWLKDAGIKARTVSEGKRIKGGQGPSREAITASVLTRRKRPLPGRPDVGYRVDGYGYVHVMTAGGYRREHILVMEAQLGRSLAPNENVHHINGDRKDNRAVNLEVMTGADHSREHSFTRCRRPDGSFAPDGEGAPKVGRPVCKVADCPRPARRLGWCDAHRTWSKNHDGAIPTHRIRPRP